MTASHTNSRLIPAGTEQPNVLHALIRKRSEIAGRIEHLQFEMRMAVADLDSIDAAIHVFDPTIEFQEKRSKPVPPRHQAFKGEMSRIVFSTLRTARIKLTTAHITARVIAERGLDGADPRLRKLISNRAGAALRFWEKKGLIRTERGPDNLKYWEIVPCGKAPLEACQCPNTAGEPSRLRSRDHCCPSGAARRHHVENRGAQGPSQRCCRGA